MNEVIILDGTKPQKILQAVLDKKIPVFMSYLSGHRWHVVRGLLTNLSAGSFGIKLSPRKKTQMMNLKTGQTVGISFKFGSGDGYDRLVFDTTVATVESLSESTTSGMISLAMPEQIELVQRRSYLRVEVPESLKVNVQLWHRYFTSGGGLVCAEVHENWQGRLIDISAEGLQVAIDTAQGPDFEKSQSVGLRFTPLPYETQLVFNARVRSILLSADERSICLGLQMVGLEASPEGRLILRRLCNVVEQYYQMHQSSDKK